MTTTTTTPPTSANPTPKRCASAGFNLRHLTMTVLSECGDPDPGAVADVLVDRIPRKAYRHVLRLLLRSYVREVNRGHQSSPAPAIVAPASNPTPRGQGWKVQSIRESWRRKRFHVGDGDWAFGEDLTYDHLMAIARERYDLSKANATAGDDATAAAGLLIRYGVTRLGDVPDDEVVRTALGTLA
jgi:hypothetical protein